MKKATNSFRTDFFLIDGEKIICPQNLIVDSQTNCNWNYLSVPNRVTYLQQANQVSLNKSSVQKTKD